MSHSSSQSNAPSGTAALQFLIDYISQYAPDFPTTIRGASSAQIIRLEELIQRPLPPSYRAFLEFMGESTGTLELWQGNMDTSIETVIDHYSGTEWLPPPEFIFFALDTGPQGSDLFLDCTQPEREPSVVRGEPSLDFRSTCRVKSESLMDALTTTALLTIRMPQLLFRASMYATESWTDRFKGQGIKIFEQTAQKLGFMRIPFTGAWSPGYERGDSAMHAYEAPGFLPSFELASQSDNELRKLVEILKDSLGLLRDR
jgi:hypothetical protein